MTEESYGPPQRVVSLLPSATELIFAVGQGERVVGVTLNDNYPPPVASLPKVGDQTIDLEKVLELRPDLVVLDSSFNSDRENLERLNLRVLELSCHRLNDVPAAMLALGQALECTERAQREARAFEASLAAIEPLRRDDLIFVEVWGDPLMTVGSETLIADLMERLGLKSCYADQTGYFQVDPEDMVVRRPDIVLLPAKTDIAESRAFKLCKSVGHEPQLVRIDPDLLVRPGPRLIDGLKIIRSRIAEVPSTH